MLTNRINLKCRKLKNRVAAQTARDRKKARMTELEESLALFEEQVNIYTFINQFKGPLIATILWVLACKKAQH